MRHETFCGIGYCLIFGFPFLALVSGLTGMNFLALLAVCLIALFGGDMVKRRRG